ncbi:hypothetical protein E2C01_092294 [Portunus trituberculatus]|uniref:Uncharacterized protein n=1 Tax=Portunus trituberculatus TaxID=210409 RepID=A0A5B7JV33_PORTR|nr:hypothetical protein [Portunus trituberculatus]
MCLRVFLSFTRPFRRPPCTGNTDNQRNATEYCGRVKRCTANVGMGAAYPYLEKIEQRNAQRQESGPRRYMYRFISNFTGAFIPKTLTGFQGG